jgi:hypothetical protein
VCSITTWPMLLNRLPRITFTWVIINHFKIFLQVNFIFDTQHLFSFPFPWKWRKKMKKGGVGCKKGRCCVLSTGTCDNYKTNVALKWDSRCGITLQLITLSQTEQTLILLYRKSPDVNRGDAVSCPQAPVIVVSYLHSYTYKYIQVPTRHTHWLYYKCLDSMQLTS